jgi:hypothetical protein
VPGFWEFKERTYWYWRWQADFRRVGRGGPCVSSSKVRDVGDPVPIQALVETAQYAADVLFVYYLMD